MKISKLLIYCTAALGAMFFAVQQTQAVSGYCHNCHTMHNSEQGVTMGGDPSDYLLNVGGGCLGCHEGASGASFKTVGASTQVPLVSHTGATAPTYTTPNATGVVGNILAGGSFWWVQNASVEPDKKGHNVDDLGIFGAGHTDNIIGGHAPGGNETPALFLSEPLRCQTDGNGVGCHARGGHHTNLNPSDDLTNPMSIDGSAADSTERPGESYRFLASEDDGLGDITGVSGYEDNDYNWTVASGAHNVHYGDLDANTTDLHTMSSLCKRCHGAFHSSAADPIGVVTGGTPNVVSPWLRHPTDISMSQSANAEYDEIIGKGYNPGVPTASTDISTVPAGLTANQDDIVACTSCHFAHGGPYNYLLRWDYDSATSTDMLANAGTSLHASVDYTAGCFYCHSTKEQDY